VLEDVTYTRRYRACHAHAQREGRICRNNRMEKFVVVSSYPFTYKSLTILRRSWSRCAIIQLSNTAVTDDYNSPMAPERLREMIHSSGRGGTG
jgi:hypothetical protein